MMKYFSLFLLITTLLLFAACSGSDSDDNNTNGSDSLANQEDSSTIQTSYRLPSPVELYQIMKIEGVRFNSDMLNDTKKAESYMTTRDLALNFGVYASDLAYCTVYDKPQKTFLYFEVSKTLADKLGVAEGFDEIVANKLEQNLGSSDSLYEITNQAYWDACNYLEAEQKQDQLSLIMAGAWIESLYILYIGVEKYRVEDPLMWRIAEQRFLLENLIDHLKSLGELSDKELIKVLEDLQISFDTIYDNADDMPITKKQYDEIYQKVKQIRSNIVK